MTLTIPSVDCESVDGVNCLGSEPETSSGVAIGVIVIILVVVIVIILVIGECVLARDWPHANRGTLLSCSYCLGAAWLMEVQQ